MRRVLLALSCVSMSMFAGCVDNAVLIPSSDAALNKTSAAYASDAKASFPYPADLQRSNEIDARAEIGYMVNAINLVNFSGKDWENIEIWINKSYVLPLPRFETGKTKRMSFKLFYNDQGVYLPLKGSMIESVEIKKDGTLYTVPTQIGG